MFFLFLLYFTSLTIFQKLPLIYISWYNLVNFNSAVDSSECEKKYYYISDYFLILSLLSPLPGNAK